MKKSIRMYLKFVVIFLCILGVGIFHSCRFKKTEISSISQIPLHRARLFVTDQGNPTQATLHLLAALNLSHDGTLQNIVDVTQKHLLRPAGKERWQSPESVYEKQRDKIVLLLKQLELLQEIQAQKKQYDYAIVLGATATSVRKRLAFLVREWNRGVRFDHIIMLAGQRPLDAELESLSVLYDRKNKELPIRQSWHEPQSPPKTETEMMRMIFEQAQLPEALAKVQFRVIDTPMQKRADGSVCRPTTGDTVNAWLAQNHEPGNCLVISNQPYVAYQDSVMRYLMPKSFTIETIGSNAQETERLSTLLDTVARTLYQEYQSFKSLEKK